MKVSIRKSIKERSQQGRDFERDVLDLLKCLGTYAERTNTLSVFNPHGINRNYDGGVDIINVFDREGKLGKTKLYFIQCKKITNQLEAGVVSDLKSAMYFRGADDNSVGVIFCDGPISQLTRNYAQKLSIELFTPREYRILKKVAFGNNLTSSDRKAITGEFLPMLLYCVSKNKKWLNRINPETSESVSQNIQRLNTLQKMSEEEILESVFAREHINVRIQEEKLLEIIRLTKENKSCTEIYEITGVTTKTVSRYKTKIYSWFEKNVS